MDTNACGALMIKPDSAAIRGKTLYSDGNMEKIDGKMESAPSARVMAARLMT